MDEATQNKSQATLVTKIADTAEQVKAAVAETPRPEISASALGRMMGLATGTEIRLLESKLDMLSTRLSNLTVRLEKAMSVLAQIPTGSDLERIDVQIGALKTLIKDSLAGIARAGDTGVDRGRKSPEPEKEQELEKDTQ